MSLDEALNFDSERKPEYQVYQSLIGRNNCNYAIDECIEHILGLKENLGDSNDKISISVLKLENISKLDESEYDGAVKAAIDSVKKVFPKKYIYRLDRDPDKNEDSPEVYIGIVHLNVNVEGLKKKAKRIITNFKSINKSDVRPIYSVVGATCSVLQEKADKRLVLEAMDAFDDKYFHNEENTIMDFELN